ncbi:MAG: transposase [Pirellulales bacterium]
MRGNGGFCRWKLMRWCDKHGVDYIFGMGRNKVLERRIAPLMEKAETAFEATGEKQRLFGETDYTAKSWDCPRRVTVSFRRIVLHLSSSCPYQKLFRHVAAKLIPAPG